MKNIFFVFLLVLITACSSVRIQPFRNGNKVMYSAVCGGRKGMNACLKRADLMCPKGYEIVSSGTHQTAGLATQSNYMVPVNQTTIVFNCK